MYEFLYGIRIGTRGIEDYYALICTLFERNVVSRVLYTPPVTPRELSAPEAQ